jgi:hypothetical protein
VTPKKHGDYRQLTASGGIESGHPATTFWAEWPAVWFTQAEAQFFLAGINSKKTKFFYVISQIGMLQK